MGSKPSYFRIGIFVILAVALIVGAVVVFGGGIIRRDKTFFETYFETSIAGLSVGSPVEIRGVRIGQVESISFANFDYEIATDPGVLNGHEFLVRVVCSADRTEFKDLFTPAGYARLESLVEDGLRLRLATNILTGISYLEGLFLDPERFPVLEVPWEPDYPYLPAAPGELDTLKTSLDRILSNLERVDLAEITASVQQLLNTVTLSIEGANIPELSNEMKQLLSEARDTNKYIQTLLVGADHDVLEANLADSLQTLDAALNKLDDLLDRQSPRLNVTMENLRIISENIREFTEHIRRNPSELIFDRGPTRGPEVFE